MPSSQQPVQLIGVDCAVDPKRVGLASARFEKGTLRDLELFAPQSDGELRRWIVTRLECAGATLLAMDSPLGWPAALGESLAPHTAGKPLAEAPDRLFRRLTDRVVRERTGKQPLDVGADRIARTARAALALLDAVAGAVGQPIELAWSPLMRSQVEAIETYPAAWLLYEKLPAQGYKDAGSEATERRGRIATRIDALIEGGLSAQTRALMLGSSHLLDGAICVLCAVEFLRGRCPVPPDSEMETARKEGWIWFPLASD